MVQKILNLTAFKNSVEYIVNKDRANFLDTNLISKDTDKIINSFLNRIHLAQGENKKGKELKNIGKHFILSFHPNEHVSPQKKIEIAKYYLQEQGYQNSDYVIVEHNDTDHEHIHIIASRLDRETNKAVKDNNERFNGRRICFELENNYNLIRTSSFAKTKENMLLRNEYQNRGDKYHKGDLLELIHTFNFEEKTPSEFSEHLKEKGFNIYVTESDKKILFEKNGFTFTQKNLGKEVNIKLKQFKEKMSDKDKSIRYLKDFKELKMFVNEKTKLFIDYELLHKKYKDAQITYRFDNLQINDFKRYAKSDINFRTSSVNDKEAHVENLKKHNLDEFRFNPAQLSDILLAKTPEEKEKLIKQALEFNTYRIGEVVDYYISDTFNIERQNPLIKVNNEEKVKNFMKEKITNASSETERSIYLLSARIICRDIKNHKLQFNNNIESKSNNIISLITNKYDEILSSREAIAQRIADYKLSQEKRAAQEYIKTKPRSKAYVQSMGGKSEFDIEIEED